MLCTKCEKLPTPTNVAGNCKRCSDKTQFFAYKLCSECSLSAEQCERCEVPLNAPSSSRAGSGPSAFALILTDADNGQSRTGMHPGEEIIVRLEEDQYSQTEWGAKSGSGANSGFYLKANNGFVPYTGQYQKGTRELVFEIAETGTLDLDLEEKTRATSYYSSSSYNSNAAAANGRRWTVAIQST